MDHRKLKAGTSKTPVLASTESTTEAAKWTIVVLLVTTLAGVGVLVTSVGVAGVGISTLASVAGVGVSSLARTGVSVASASSGASLNKER